MKTFAWLFGLALLGGLIVLAVAGVTGATAVLVTGAAIVAMIALGSMVGGRTTPNKAPFDPAARLPSEPPAPSPGDGPAEGTEGGTMGP